MQCFVCDQPVEDPVHEAACGQAGHPASPFHAICLMRWRDAARLLRERLLARGWLDDVDSHDR